LGCEQRRELRQKRRKAREHKMSLTIQVGHEAKVAFLFFFFFQKKFPCK